MQKERIIIYPNDLIKLLEDIFSFKKVRCKKSKPFNFSDYFCLNNVIRKNIRKENIKLFTFINYLYLKDGLRKIIISAYARLVTFIKRIYIKDVIINNCK